MIKKFLLIVVLFTALLFVVPTGLIDSNYGNIILTIGTFLFGIFGGFCIVITTTDYNVVRNLASRETSSWISLYQAVVIYNKNIANEFKPLISKYIIRSFDYDFINYARETKKEFGEVVNYLTNIEIIENQSSAYEKMLDHMTGLVSARQELTTLGKKSLSFLEWGVLSILSIIVITTLFGLRGDAWFFDFVTVAVSSVIILVLLLINDIDRYVWNEASFSFEVFNNVLLAIGELPYYPAEFVSKGIVTPMEEKYRIGILTNPGKSFERRIEVAGQN